jgi:hypothetical protein
VKGRSLTLFPWNVPNKFNISDVWLMNNLFFNLSTANPHPENQMKELPMNRKPPSFLKGQ